MEQENKLEPLEIINSYDELVDNLVDWDNAPTIGDLKNDITQAASMHSAHIADVDRWFSILEGELDPSIKIVEGRSRIQPKLGRKQGEWRYPSLENPFLSSPDLFNIHPATYADVLAAKQNEQILNKQFRVDIPRVKFINTYVRTAVNTGTALVKVGWDERIGMTWEEYEEPVYAQSEEEKIAFLGQQVRDGVLTEDIAMALAESNEPIVIDIMKKSREVEKVLFNGPVLDVRDSRNVIIDPTCEGDISKANFIVDTFMTDLSTLRKDGRYSNLEFIDVSSNSLNTPNDIPTTYELDYMSFEYADAPRKKLLVHEYWGYWDINGTGTVEAIVASFVGDIMIRLELNPFPDKKLPFVLVQYLPPLDNNTIYGEPDVALIEDNQAIIGAITRGVLDVFGRHANAQQGFAKGFLDDANFDRFRKGQDYFFNPQFQGLQNSYVQSTLPDFPKGAFDLLQYQNGEAQELTGNQPFGGGQYGGANGTSVGGIKTALDATAKREVSILQRLSQGLIEIGRKITTMNAVWLTDEEIIRITDEEFITVSKTSLSGQYDLAISISTAEEDDQKAQELSFLLQTLGNTTDFGVMKIIMAKIADLRRMPDVVKAIEEYEPQPDPVAEELKNMQLVLAQLEAEKMKTEIAENLAQIDRYTAQAEKERALTDHIRSTKDKVDLDFIEQATGLTQDRELEKLRENKSDEPKSKPAAKTATKRKN